MKLPGIDGHLYLIGFMGSGKSAMGRLLAERLERPFLDLDEIIEQQQQRPVTQIFSELGEPFFRECESRLLEQLARRSPAVVATGGGTFGDPANRKVMQESGVVVWLNVPLELARSRALKDPERPLASHPRQFQELYRRRREIYALADIEVEVGDDPKPITCDNILEKLRQSLA